MKVTCISCGSTSTAQMNKKQGELFDTNSTTTMFKCNECGVEFLYNKEDQPIEVDKSVRVTDDGIGVRVEWGGGISPTFALHLLGVAYQTLQKRIIEKSNIVVPGSIRPQ